MPARQGEELTPDDVYRFYFHGPAYQVVSSAWRVDDAAVAQMASDLPPNNQPADVATQAQPRVIELCLQTAGLWESGREGRMALPTHVDRAVIFPRSSGEGLVATAREVGDGFDCVVTDASGTVVVRLEGYRTIVVPQPLDEDVLAPMRRVMAD